MYYERDMTQAQIAAALDVSRVKVYRLLREARETGVARIHIDFPLKRAGELEARLMADFGLRAAYALQTGAGDAALVLRQVALLAARCLEERLHDGATLAICFGRTTHEVISALRRDFQADVTVAQATGSLPQALKEYDSSALTRQLAQKLGGRARYLSAPLFADTAEAASLIREQSVVAQTLSLARLADIALVGIGDLDPATSVFARAGVAEAGQLRAYRERGAAGDMAWQVFDDEGRLFDCELNGRIIGVRLDELRATPMTIAVAAGVNKARAIRGALAGGMVDALVTDEITARAIT